jgi:carbonic anhydrase
MNIIRIKTVVISLLAILFISNSALATNKITHVITEAKQEALTPQQALLKLKAGNVRFLTNTRKTRNYLKQAKKSAEGQFPWAVVLNCMDSRSVPEFLFDTGIADMFSLSVAGNIENADIIGSMEFATQYAGSKLIVVLGHTACGAVQGACKKVTLGQLTGLLQKIEPVVQPTKKQTKLKSCQDPALINAIAKNNAIHTAKLIRQKSPIIRALIKKGKIGMIPAIHDVRTGKVIFFDKEAIMPG